MRILTTRENPCKVVLQQYICLTHPLTIYHRQQEELVVLTLGAISRSPLQCLKHKDFSLVTNVV